MRNLVLAVSLLVATAAFADERFTEAEFNKFIALKKAQATREAKEFYSRGDKAKVAAAKAEYEKAKKDSGLSDDKLSQIDEAIGNYKGTMEGEGTAAEKEQYLKEELGPKTLAVLKSRAKDVDYEKWRTDAEAAQQAEAKQSAIGKAPTQADLQGSWKLDMDSSAAHLNATMGLPDDAVKSMKDAWKSSGETTYTFKGDTVEVKTLRQGSTTPSTRTGKFRIEGNDVFMSDGKREHKIQIGVKSPKELIFSMMGVGTIYRKQ